MLTQRYKIMKKHFVPFWLAAIFMMVVHGCRSQDNRGQGKSTDRPPAVAGQFYPADPAALRAAVEKAFSQASPRSIQNVVAIICPHAGYDFSSVVAATGFNQADPDKEYDNIFVIGSSHHVSFMGASIYTLGDYTTPLGTVKVNTALGKKLMKESNVFTYNPEADAPEHSIEVQLPFLQIHQKKSFQIVPILLGTQSTQSCKKIAQALKPYLNSRNLFVISTDFSHYPKYADALTVDIRTCNAIVTNSPDSLQAALDKNDQSNIKELVTSLCGWTSVISLLDMTSAVPGITVTPLMYKNSGDVPPYDRSRVVGYWSLAFSLSDTPPPPETGFNFSTKEKSILLGIARKTIDQYIRTQKKPPVDTTGFTPNLRMKSGAFVTLNENGELRGCIGRFTSDDPLYMVIQEMAIAASTQDTRFSPVTAGEINKLGIEISVLSPMKKITSIDQIELGKDGIVVKKGHASGTFLPQVATETGWSKEEFLGHCARDKAGIGWDGWKDADIYIYEASVFSEKESGMKK
jgi:MEMO1 family protein